MVVLFYNKKCKGALKTMEKMFIDDSYILEFEANIVDVFSKDDQWIVLLDKTFFYPEGGGQPSDIGAIENLSVSYVYEEEGIVYHVVDEFIEKGTKVKCKIDSNIRFDHMQQHCGQHILSAAFDNILGGNTVGFHLGEEFVTVDIDINTLSVEDAERVENLANEIVFKNLPIKYIYPSSDELKNFKLRKEPSVEENIRIVEIQGVDYSPCCGTHPNYTGEVGLIKIRKWEKYKDYYRVEFVCGMRALNDYRWKNNYINELSLMLSSKDTDLLCNAKKSFEELMLQSKQIKQLKDTNLNYEAESLYREAEEYKGIKIIKKLFADRDFKEVIALSNKITKYNSAVALLGTKSDTARMVFSSSKNININMNSLFKEVAPLINGKGGGNPHSAQGGGSDISNLESALESASIIIKNRYIK